LSPAPSFFAFSYFSGGGALQLFAGAGFEPWSSWSLSPKELGLQACTATLMHILKASKTLWTALLLPVESVGVLWTSSSLLLFVAPTYFVVTYSSKSAPSQLHLPLTATSASKSCFWPRGHEVNRHLVNRLFVNGSSCFQEQPLPLPV
jgi:hypothetical protein